MRNFAVEKREIGIKRLSTAMGRGTKGRNEEKERKEEKREGGRENTRVATY